MKSNKRLLKIEKNSFDMGNKAYETFKETNSFKALNSAVRAYNASMQALSFQLVYGQIKKKKY